MSIGPRGENLIFLISQPRAGSTLLQRMLWCHPEFHTSSESWLMLHPLYGLRPAGSQADYNAAYARTAAQEFLQKLPEGDDAYMEGIRRMYVHLYGRAIESSGKRFYLDKTPPYYLIIPELYRVFPGARYIILLRNPLAVLGSILHKWIKEHPFWLHTHRHDLLHAPRLLIDSTEFLGAQGLVVRYEQVVADPMMELRRICTWLNVQFVSDMVDYGRRELPRWTLGDEHEVYQHGRPVERNATKWTQGLKHPQTWRFTNDYLHMLGKNAVERMGYSYDDLQRALTAQRPTSRCLWGTVSLAWALQQPTEPSVRRGLQNLVDIGARKLAFSISSFVGRYRASHT